MSKIIFLIAFTMSPLVLAEDATLPTIESTLDQPMSKDDFLKPTATRQESEAIEKSDRRHHVKEASAPKPKRAPASVGPMKYKKAPPADKAKKTKARAK